MTKKIEDGLDIVNISDYYFAFSGVPLHSTSVFLDQGYEIFNKTVIDNVVIISCYLILFSSKFLLNFTEIVRVFLLFHSAKDFNIGITESPNSVSEYSTFGGII